MIIIRVKKKSDIDEIDFFFINASEENFVDLWKTVETRGSQKRFKIFMK